MTAGIVSLEENGCVGLQFDLNYAAKLFAVVKEMARICVQTCIKTTVNAKLSYISVFPLENTSALPLTNRQTAFQTVQVACCSAFEMLHLKFPLCRGIYGYSRCWQEILYLKHYWRLHAWKHSTYEEEKRQMQSLQIYFFFYFFSFASAERNTGLRHYHALNCQSDLISDLLKVTGRNQSSLG